MAIPVGTTTIRKQSDIIQKTTEVGKNYTGIGNLGTIASLNPRPLRYGFILIPGNKPPKPSNWEQLILPYAPESIIEDEPAATTITPTQNSGKFIERRGQLIKNITLSGTTGYEPSPTLPQIVRSASPAGFIVETEGPNSGLAKFLELRNLFRTYWQIFSDDDKVAIRDKTVFAFINEKDDEQWIVEPISFRMTRQSPRDKFIYHYEIVLQTIAPLESLKFGVDDLTTFEKIANAITVIRDLVDKLTAAVAIFGAAISLVAGAIRQAANILMNTVNNIISALSSIADGIKSLIDLKTLVTGNSSIFSTMQASFQAAMENFESISDKVKTDTGNDPVPFEAYQQMSDMALNIAILAGRTELYSKDFNTSWTDATVDFDPTYGFGGFNNLLIDPLTKQGVREAEILPGDDLVNIAIKELGDAERFMEIVVLNNLKPPYISPSQEARLPNTLAPGDAVLVPSVSTPDTGKSIIKTTVFSDPTFLSRVITGGSLTSKLDVGGNNWRINQWVGFTAKITEGPGLGEERKVVSNTIDEFTVDLSWTVTPTNASAVKFYLKHVDLAPLKSANEQALGTDLKLINGDLVVAKKGDLDLIDGIPNIKQAVSARMATRNGELPIHPDYGLGWDPGRKGDPDTLFGYKVAVKQSLLADKRVEAVEQMQIEINRDVLSLQAYVVLNGIPQAFSVDTRGA